MGSVSDRGSDRFGHFERERIAFVFGAVAFRCVGCCAACIRPSIGGDLNCGPTVIFSVVGCKLECF